VPRAFSLDCFDAELRSRNSSDEWRRILALRDQPGFLRGLFRYAELMPPYFSDNVNLNKVVTEAWRFHMLVFALHLYDSRDPNDPSSGLTFANLTRLCAEQKIASRGRVFAILGIMQLAGYLRRRRSTSDSRIVQLEPSPVFIGIVEGWNQRILQIIDAIDDTEALAVAHLAHRRFGWEMREHGAQTILAGWKILDPFPETAHFVYSDGGWMLLLSCVADALRASGGREIAPVCVDLGTFGKRFGVSRSHLRRLLEQAHNKGLLDAPPRNGQHIALAPHLVASFLTCMASELGNYRLWALAAKRELGVERERRNVGVTAE
jgi:hypothetical protein